MTSRILYTSGGKTRVLYGGTQISSFGFFSKRIEVKVARDRRTRAYQVHTGTGTLNGRKKGAYWVTMQENREESVETGKVQEVRTRIYRHAMALE